MTAVLWYSNETPDVRGQGGQRRQYFQIRSLLEAGHEVTVVTLAGDQDDASIRSLTDVHRLPPLDRRARLLRLARLTGDDAVFGTLTWDCAVIAHIESWLHLRERRVALPGAQLLDLHNVFSSWCESRGELREAARWRKLEIAAAGGLDAITVCSERERSAFLASTGRDSLVVPHGIEPAEWPRDPQPAAQAVMKLFGNWDWEPNRHGLTWFLDQVAPRTIAATGITIEVAGRGTEQLAPVDGVTFVGRVPDVPDFLADAWVVGLPVMQGVGAPVKFAEAVVTGVPLVATVDGASGSDDAPGVLVSDDPAAWGRWIEQVVADPEQPRAASRDRRTKAFTDLSWSRTTEPLRRWVEHR